MFYARRVRFTRNTRTCRSKSPEEHRKSPGWDGGAGETNVVVRAVLSIYSTRDVPAAAGVLLDWRVMTARTNARTRCSTRAAKSQHALKKNENFHIRADDTRDRPSRGDGRTYATGRTKTRIKCACLTYTAGGSAHYWNYRRIVSDIFCRKRTRFGHISDTRRWRVFRIFLLKKKKKRSPSTRCA